jgi:hypothetical protein
MVMTVPPKFYPSPQFVLPFATNQAAITALFRVINCNRYEIPRLR